MDMYLIKKITLQVLHLMSIYNGMSGKESNLEQSYVLLDLASQIASRARPLF